MAEELARCHPFRGNATVSCDSSSGYMLPGPVCGPDSAVKPREIIQTPRSEQPAATQGASARITTQAAPTMSPSLDPGSRLLGVWGSSTPKKHKADFNHFFSFKLDSAAVEPAQRMFSHPARQRPLSPPWHCSVPSRGRDPGHLEKSKRNKEHKQQIQRQSEKITNHQNYLSVCPCQGWCGHLLQQKALGWAIFVFSLIFFEGASYWLICYSTSFIINFKKTTIQPSQQQTKRKSRHRKRNAMGSGVNACHSRCHLPFGKPQGKKPIFQLEEGREGSIKVYYKQTPWGTNITFTSLDRNCTLPLLRGKRDVEEER